MGEVTREEWNAFAAGHPLGGFLQSWEWGEFQEACGREVARVSERNESGALSSAGMFLRHPLPLGFLLYSPRGPVAADRGAALRLAKAAAAGKSPVFVRIETPFVQKGPDAEDGFLKYLNQPQNTRVLDLSAGTDALLATFKPKTRYNIRIAERHGVEAREVSPEEGVKIFVRLSREVEAEGRFHYHADEYYSKMAAVLGGKMLRVMAAFHGGEPLAAGIFIDFGGTVTYAHGASSKAKKHVMAPYLLHWRAILDALSRGAKKYDLYGVAPTRDESHPWSGVTRFKAGFAGTEVSYAAPEDMIVRPAVYRALRLAYKLKKKIA